MARSPRRVDRELTVGLGEIARTCWKPAAYPPTNRINIADTAPRRQTGDAHGDLLVRQGHQWPDVKLHRAHASPVRRTRSIGASLFLDPGLQRTRETRLPQPGRLHALGRPRLGLGIRRSRAGRRWWPLPSRHGMPGARIRPSSRSPGGERGGAPSHFHRPGDGRQGRRWSAADLLGRSVRRTYHHWARLRSDLAGGIIERCPHLLERPFQTGRERQGIRILADAQLHECRA